jgi:hypothetical protein
MASASRGDSNAADDMAVQQERHFSQDAMPVCTTMVKGQSTVRVIFMYFYVLESNITWKEYHHNREK